MSDKKIRVVRFIYSRPKAPPSTHYEYIAHDIKRSNLPKSATGYLGTKVDRVMWRGNVYYRLFGLQDNG